MASLITLLYTLTGVLCKRCAIGAEVKLGDSIKLPCEKRNYTDTPVEQLDVQWWLDEQLVIRLDRGQVSYGISYRNRTKLPVGGASSGDFSLNITNTQHGDSGVYRCVTKKENQEESLDEVQLKVEVPRSPTVVFVEVGGEAVLPCFGRADWMDSEAELVQWSRGDKIVLQWEKGFLHVEPPFTDRVSLSKEGILKDNLSLVLRNTLHADHGQYHCDFVKNQRIQHGAQINLTVTDHKKQMEAGFGTSVLLPLHTTSEVTVCFLSDGGNNTDRVCEVKEDQLKCEAAYTHRMVLQGTSLQLENLSLLDSGTFSVIERKSQHTVSVLFLQVSPTGGTKIDADLSPTQGIILVVGIILAAIIGILFVIGSIKLIKFRTRRRRQRRRHNMELVDQEGHHLNHIEATSSKVKNDVA